MPKQIVEEDIGALFEEEAPQSVALQAVKWEGVDLQIPVGTGLFRNDPKSDPKYLEVSHKVKLMHSELTSAKVKVEEDKPALVEKVKLTQRLKLIVEDERTRFTRPLDDKKKEFQAIFKAALLDLLEEGKTAANAEMDRFDNAQRIARAEEDRKRGIERKKTEEYIKKTNPEAVILPPVPTVHAPIGTVRTEVGTRSQKKVVDWKTIDLSKVPPEYTYLVVDQQKVDLALRGLTAEINEPCEKELIPGILATISYKGSVR